MAHVEGVEQDLARAVARLDHAQRLAHVGSWEWEVAGDTVTWTDEMYRIYGIGRAEFGGSYESFLEYVVPADREYTTRVISEAYASRQPFDYDHRIRRSDGAVRMLHTRGEVVVDASGRVARLAGACWDITERYETSQECDQLISLLRATLESTADGLLVVGLDGHIVAHNQRLLELWGLQHLQIEHLSFEALLHQVHEALENGDECLARVRALATAPADESFDVLRFRDGRVFERYSRPQRVGETIVGRVWSYRDVSDREHLLVRALLLSDASRLLASLGIDAALESTAARALTRPGDGCAIDLCEHGVWRRVVEIGYTGPPPGATVPSVPTRMPGASPVMIIPLRAHGEILGTMSFSSSARLHDDRDLGLASELGRRVEMAVENARLHQEARAALNARDEFLALAAHEVRGPVTSIHLAVQSLPDADAEQAARLRGIIEREDRRLARLVDELLDMTAIQRGQMTLELQQVDLVEVVTDVVQRVAGSASRAGSELSVRAPARLVGCWDRSRLDQVVHNLLSNAIRFGLGRPIEVTVEEADGQAVFAVRDHGVGIAADAHNRIFELFERAVPPRHYGGLGIGLYVVRHVVARLGGTLSLSSRLNAGSTFTVRLPLGKQT